MSMAVSTGRPTVTLLWHAVQEEKGVHWYK